MSMTLSLHRTERLCIFLFDILCISFISIFR